MTSYAPLHRHTTHSIYDGFMSPEEGVKYAVKMGYPALGISDHGNMNGVIEHYVACKKYGVHPVLGVESYFQPIFSEEKRDYHITIFAKNVVGYQHLCQLISYANQYQWANRHGVVTFETLSRYREGLIVTSGCVGGVIPQCIIKGQMNAAHAMIQGFRKIFGDDFVFEVMPFPVFEHQQEREEGNEEETGQGKRNIQKLVNETLLELAQQYDRRVIMTDDSHYVSGDDYENYLLLKKISGIPLIANYENLYLHSAEQMALCWETMMGTDGTPYMQNAVDLALSCQVDLHFDEKEMIPKIDWGVPSLQKLRDVASQSLKAKEKWGEAYQLRLVEELDVVEQMGIGVEDYLLLCWDLVEFAKKADIAMGYGRGSVCNSLLGYALGLTQVDPVFLQTDFERFLRKDKRLLPDCDFDFDPLRREEIVSYLVQRYNGSAYQISNFTYYKAKLLVNDMAKQFPTIPDYRCEGLKGLLEAVNYDETRLSYRQLLEHNRFGSEFQKFDDSYPGFLELFVKLHGQVKNVGKHAAGIALAPNDITKFVPIIRIGGKGKKGEEPKFQTGYNMKSLGELHVLKLDALGVDKVTVVREVEKQTGCSFDYRLLQDEKVYAELAAGRTDAVFQFESFGMRRFLRDAKPKTFADMYTCNALYRPGASANIPDYVRSREEQIELPKDVPGYSYLEETNGILVFDEQKMRLARYIGHMDWADVDLLMKQAKKGKVDDELKQKFLCGAIEQEGLKERDAKNLIEMMSRYSFNKGHAVGYSLLAFYSLWQRLYYPLEYYTAVLRREKEKEKRVRLEGSAILSNLVLLTPHVNGTGNYQIYRESDYPTIQIGLETIPHVGAKATQAIMRLQREDGYFSDKEEFLERILPVKRVVNKGVVEALFANGALEFDLDSYLKNCELYGRSLKKMALEERRRYEYRPRR